MLKRLRITGYKSLVDIDVELSSLAVLFGPNAAGKSNFLDAVQLLSRTATCQTLKEAFDPPYRGKPLESFTFGPNGLSELLQRESASFTLEADVMLSTAVVDEVNRQIQEMKRGGASPDHRGTARRSSQTSLVRERSLRYRLTIEILPKSGILRVTDEYLAALNSKGEPTGSRQPFLEKNEDHLRLRMEGQGHPSYRDLNLDHSVLYEPLYAPHYPHMVAMKRELSSWFLFYFEPRERMRESNPVREVKHIGLMGEELASFLNTLKHVDNRQFHAVEMALKCIVPSVTGVDVHVNNFGEVELRLKEGGALVPARVVSEGTLRILGLLALEGVKEPPALIGFEEPENGIHPRRIELVADMLRNRASQGRSQLIVTTHSPHLLDRLPADSLHVCRKEGGRTRITPFHTWGPLGQSQDVDKALNAGDMHLVSERLLRGDFDA